MDQRSGSFSKATSNNPKDLLGASKVSITKVPAVAILHTATAMMNGSEKYGPYNWRAKNVSAAIYIDAALRHLFSWFEGEEVAEDSGVHHLGHAMACCAILLDAQSNGNLVDDRPSVAAFKETIERLNKAIKEKKKPAPREEEAGLKYSLDGGVNWHGITYTETGSQWINRPGATVLVTGEPRDEAHVEVETIRNSGFQIVHRPFVGSIPSCS